MLLKQTKLKLRSDTYITAVSYRIPMQVREIHKLSGNDSYPVCPKCACTIDREYMQYCDRCGQCLAWDDFENATVVRV